MALAGKVVVVAGSSGVVGSGIARAFLEKGATVVAPVRSDKSKANLGKDFEGVDTKSLDVPILDVGTEAGASELAKHISEKYGSVDHIVSSLGAWWQGGPLLQQSLETYQKELYNLSTTHFVFAKAILPLLKDSPESSYTIITGGAGEVCFMLDASLVTVGAATLFGISLAIRAEYKDKAPRVNELRIYSRIERHEAAISGTTGITHRAVGGMVVDIATSTKKGEVVKGNNESLGPYTQAS